MHKYLDEAGIADGNRPWTWDEEDDERAERWKEEREIYGFDSRETWCLFETFYLWLYERLRMFKDYNIIDLSYHKFNYNGNEYTQGQLIDMMLERLELYFSDKYDEFNPMLDDSLYERVHEIEKIWSVVIPAMWW